MAVDLQGDGLRVERGVTPDGCLDRVFITDTDAFSVREMLLFAPL